MLVAIVRKNSSWKCKYEEQISINIVEQLNEILLNRYTNKLSSLFYNYYSNNWSLIFAVIFNENWNFMKFILKSR